LKKTPAEKVRLQSKHNAKKAAYHSALGKAWSVLMEHAEQLHGEFRHHSTDYYYEEMIQLARKTKVKRAKINMWNAFTRLQAHAVNEGMFLTIHLLYNDPNTNFHGEGNNTSNPTLAASQLAPSLPTQWKVMTHDEKVAATSGTMDELKVQWETKALAVQNTRLSAFHHVCNNLDVIEEEVCPSTAPSSIDLILVG